MVVLIAVILIATAVLGVIEAFVENQSLILSVVEMVVLIVSTMADNENLLMVMV